MISKRESDQRAVCNEPHLIGLPLQGLMIAPLSFELLAATVEEDRREQWLAEEQKSFYIKLQARVLDRDDAQPRVIAFAKQISKRHVESSPGYMAAMMRDALREMITHEIDELLLRDGVRIRETHK